MADMGVSVDKTRRNIEAAYVQDFRRLATRVSGARTDVTYSPVKYRNLHSIEDFSGINVYNFSAGNDKIGFHFSHCALDQAPQFALRSHYIPFVTHHYLGYQSCVASQWNQPGPASAEAIHETPDIMYPAAANGRLEQRGSRSLRFFVGLMA
jgi:hypothetical protein